MKIEEFKNKIFCAESLEFIKQIPDNSINCIITSPPYNKGFYGKKTPSKHDLWKRRNIEYGEFKDDLEPEKYIKQQTNVLKELVRIVKEDGSIFYNHKSQTYNHKLVFPNYVFKFNVRQIIIWDRGGTPQLAPIRFLPTTEYIFWITKTNIQPKFYRKGEFKKDVWRINPKPTEEHPAPFPIELAMNCIISTTDKDDIILDPFIGSGTTALAAKQLSRNYIGIDINEKYCEIAKQKLRQGILL